MDSFQSGLPELNVKYPARERQASFLRLSFFCVWIGLVFSVAPGCVRLSPSSSLHPPQEVSEDMRAYFDYPRKEVAPQRKMIEENKKYVLEEVTFDLNLPAELIETPVAEMRKEVAEKWKNNDVKGAKDLELEYSIKIDYYRSKKEGKKPLILVSPILGGNMIVDWVSAYLASHGMDAAIVHRRKPRYDTSKDMNQVEGYIRKSVIRTRQALDWLIEQPGTDADRVGSFGISYGGIVNTITAAVEPRIKCHIIAMAGGPMGDLIVDSEEKAIKKYVRTAAEQAGYTPETLRAALKKGIKSDTLPMAAYIKTEDVLFVIAYFDRVVGRKYSLNLWRALGRPEVIWTPLGHYSTILTLPYLRYKALKFYRRHFYPKR